MSLTKDIKDFALDIGYSAVGVTSADEFADFIRDFQSRGTTFELFSRGPFVKGAKPRAIMPSARSIISVVWDYAQKAFPESLVGQIGRIYQARSYSAPPHHINGARYRLLVDFLKKAGCEVGEGVTVPERQAAARAGLVSFGKNNFSYAKYIGSFVFLSSIVVNKELEYDAPIQDLQCPKDCTRCIDACPTRAIYEPLKLDPKRCIAFNNFFTQDELPGRSSYIAPEIREKIGARVYGCDACQEACPRNASRLKAILPRDEFLVRWSEKFSLPNMLEMSDSYYEKIIRPIMYNYIKDKKYLQRNAAIALGNTRDPQHIPVLNRSMEDPEEIVRGYAAWALGRIGGHNAKAVLESRSKEEKSAFVVSEIKGALPACDDSPGSAG